MLGPIQCLVDARARVGESPVWDAGGNRLFWVDIAGCSLSAVDLASGAVRSWPLPAPVGSIALCAKPNGMASDDVAVALPDGVHILSLATGALRFLVDPEPGMTTNRLNDGKAGPDGAFWVGSMDDRPAKEPVAALHRIAPDGTAERKVEGLLVSNGLAWSADGRTLFHSDSRGPWIDRWSFDPATGALGDRTRIATLTAEEGRPDGGATDVEGCYWSCGVSAGCLNRFAPDGTLLQRIPVPVPAPTMCAFGGPDMRTLFITSLRDGLSDDALLRHPQSGGVFMARAEVAGVPVGRFQLASSSKGL
ncbi:sugar lactone lactonase YvrE [Azospirillum agricola]|uniref:SMP-30/gluconolactonase/LRE family protein n=1 Tax=Azospirillum agricola TaxID=1720247 RepID=UPI001AE43D87|nr:SMP-30/gluconolactonase/LRE family protein [Azospirillum agricola]MBP2231463.1 sugar lactone lactonase YvrE [Azospirillum agricola]